MAPAATTETVTLRGEGGSDFTFDLPLRQQFAERVLSGRLRAATPEDAAKLGYLFDDEPAAEPVTSEEVDEPDLSCPEPGCDFVARSGGGLTLHMKTHAEDGATDDEPSGDGADDD